ncbi:hypothetical protein AXG93_949s1110 [Marchantia polymorpha subsp. ruderalis]|uniref:Hermes trasposase DNA-binding domain-containing protein n=1 Tax=Marchantia polymorpha subsp. ruderalis TaxID=1480154 RepID=A0A176VYR1_MARPO|nr:hypothetical protein AXG93_949s1110 [Marchantia polymorpha subsp. ruderalis]
MSQITNGPRMGFSSNDNATDDSIDPGAIVAEYCIGYPYLKPEPNLPEPMETNQVMTATATRRDATTSEKKLISVALADMCAVDMRPFYIVKGTGFRNYTQTVLNIGLNSKVGMLVDNILPDPTTINGNVQMRSNAGREILTAALKAHLAQGIRIGNTTDIWIDDINKVSFLSVTVHFIDDEFTLYHRTLACSPFPGPHHGSDVL